MRWVIFISLVIAGLISGEVMAFLVALAYIAAAESIDANESSARIEKMQQHIVYQLNKR